MKSFKTEYHAQGVKVEMLGRQNERNSCRVCLAHTSIFGLCSMSVCLMKSKCYSLIYSFLVSGGLGGITVSALSLSLREKDRMSDGEIDR